MTNLMKKEIYSCGKSVYEEYYELFCTTYEDGRLPDHLKKWILVSIPKKVTTKT